MPESKSKLPIPPWWLIRIVAALAIILIIANSVVTLRLVFSIANVQHTTCRAVILNQLRSLGGIDPHGARALARSYGIPPKVIPSKPNPLIKHLFKAKDLPRLIVLQHEQINVLASRCHVT